MQVINSNKAGLALGAVAGSWHLVWSALVASGWGQTVIDFVLWMHFIRPIYVVGPFSGATAAVLILVTSAIGYAVGAVFATLWNRTLIFRSGSS